MCFPKVSAAFIPMHARAFRRELVKETIMQHIRAPPTGFRFHTIKMNSTVTMKEQHTRHGVLLSLFSLNLESEIYQHDTR
jgi:hypothetical protein